MGTARRHHLRQPRAGAGGYGGGLYLVVAAHI
jgi:hypothetical protein